jgi:hypothetical protein
MDKQSIYYIKMSYNLVTLHVLYFGSLFTYFGILMDVMYINKVIIYI